MDKQRGFTLIELMVVIGIIAILSAIGIPAYQNYLRKAALTDMLQTFVPYRTAIELCALDHGGLTSCDGGSNGIPSPSTTRYVSAMSVAQGVVTLTGQESLNGLAVTLTPSWDNANGITGWQMSSALTEVTAMKSEQLLSLCQRHHAILLKSDEQTIVIAVVDTPAPELMEALRFATQKRIDIECWSQARMDKHQHEAQQSASESATGNTRGVTDLLNQILEQALRQRASDIHIEPAEKQLRIRLRVDGVLHALPLLEAALAAPMAARLKVLGNLDIAEHRLPQDGQFTLTLAGRTVSFRIATLPCRGGEKIVLRLLHQVEQALDLEALGLSSRQLAFFRAALNQPQGLLLVTGPTGSGKTVTLYSALQARNREEVNICSVEDPLEIPLIGLNQTQINPRSGLTFQSVLRALLRQDPDIVMVGEIRDAETAEIAIKAAQTGHLVLSTLHTNSTSETLIRLQQMGVARWMISSALSLVVAQRLVRKLCPHCRRDGGRPTEVPHSLWPRPLPGWLAAGCPRCYHGYYGRQALFELLPVDSALREAINRDLSAAEIETLAREAGMMTLFESGCEAVERGLTSLEEVVRVLGIPHGD